VLIDSTTRRASSGRGRALAIAALLLFAAVAAWAQQYPATLTYTGRGTYSEGLTGEPKTADASLALVSAMAVVKPVEEYPQWPKILRLRFFLPKGEDRVNVAVRQIPAPKGFYRLDNVKPVKPWVTSSVNDFEWSADIAAKVFSFQSQVGKTPAQWLAELGIVVNLRAPGEARQEMTVSPAALFHSSQPTDVGAYLFTFRPSASAEVKETFLSEATKRETPLNPRPVDGNSTFTTKWISSDQPEGWYRLALDVSFKSAPASPVQQWVVRFYHKPTLSR
jgi:hypothetical protein